MTHRVPDTIRLRIHTQVSKSPTGYHDGALAYLEYREPDGTWESVDTSLLKEWGILEFWFYCGCRENTPEGQREAAREFLEKQGLLDQLDP